MAANSPRLTHPDTKKKTKFALKKSNLNLGIEQLLGIWFQVIFNM